LPKGRALTKTTDVLPLSVQNRKKMIEISVGHCVCNAHLRFNRLV